MYMRLFKTLKARILKSIITWSEMGKQTAQAKEVYYPDLPSYPAWYSKLKEKYVLKLWEYRECKTIFKEKGDTNVRGLAAL